MTDSSPPSPLLPGAISPAYYTQRAQEFGATAQLYRTRYERWSWWRLMIFVAGLTGVVLLWTLSWWIGLLAAAVGLFGFYQLVQWHQRLANQADYWQEMARVNTREAAALGHDYAAFASGEAWTDAQHPYSLDLDLFGPFSLFQYLNRTVTAMGEAQLAEWLLQPAATATEVYSRQSAAEELASLPDWRHQWLAHGASPVADLGYADQLSEWINTPPVVSQRPALRVALWLVPLSMLLCVVLLALGLPWSVALLFLIAPGLILRQHIEYISRMHSYTARMGHTLAHYSRLIAHVEQQPFGSPRLVALRQAFLSDGHSASQDIRRLAYLVSQLDVRYNAFAIILEFGVLWSLQWLYRLEQWQAAHRTALPTWLAALGELEALSSLGNVYFNHPDWCFPTIGESEQLVARGLGHPLIADAVRVPNDIALPTQGHIHLITGSNMAGKSTWLRTVGLSIVMAQAGAPVCARRMQLPRLRVYTSMRTQDALHESTSSFYAELKRLKVIIEAVEQATDTPAESVFFLLDEILKGTNSRDRHTGAKALIRQLIRAQGAGLIATHDLELASLANEPGSQVDNWAMEVRIEHDQLVFDYTLEPGVSQSFNATHLMRRMGIRIDPTDTDL